MLKNKKIIATIIICIIFLAVISIKRLSYNSVYCHHYVEDLCSDCCIDDLYTYIDNSSLSLPLRFCIDADDLKFSSDKEKLDFCYKIQKIKTGHGSMLKYSTSDVRHNELREIIEVDSVKYHISFDITFTPRILFSEPKIIDWEAYIDEITLP